jgi:aspartyl-tRNA synthetase
VRSSYLEISNFVRASSQPCRSQQPWPQARRCLHASRKLKESTTSSAHSDYLRSYKQSSQLAVAQEHSVYTNVSKSVSFPAATDSINSLDDGTITTDREVVLHGYLGPRNDLSKKLSFVPLLSQDLSHSVQIVSSTKDAKESRLRAHETIKGLPPNTPVALKGYLRKRGAATSRDLGDIKKIKSTEIELHEVQPLNDFPKDIIIDPETIFPPEQRHLQLRQEKSLRDALHLRSRAAQSCRNWLVGRDFSEIETPLLFKSTPEGAREFIVPTRRPGLAYALPQSPQQFKQILMGSGVSRYFQIARCFRDEDLRADRQPEFTQLDLEMAFASGEDVMSTIESLISYLWKSLLEVELPSPFPRMSYHEAMSAYGSDKPDVRLGMDIARIDHLLPADLVGKISPLTLPAVDAMRLRLLGDANHPRESRKFVGSFLDSPDGAPFNSNPDGAPGIFIYDSSKPLSGLQPFGFEAAEQTEEMLDLEDGDVVVLQARQPQLSGGSTAIGNLRLALHRYGVQQGLLDAPSGFAPLWITDFPLFSPVSESEPGQGGSAGLASTHHPFTSPKTPEDVDRLMEDPSSVVGDHYDIVMNGAELGGGSRRIHHAAMQKHIMEKVLKMSAARMAEFTHLLEVLRAGCPPHAGIALGFDRLIAIMVGKDSVRDVIAFPKSGRGEDLLVRSPGKLSEEQLATYHLKLC